MEASVISGAAGRSKPICTKSSFPAAHIVYLCKWEILYLCISKYCSNLNRVHLSCIALCALSDFQIYLEQKQHWSHLQKFPSTSAKSCHHLKWTFITIIMVHTTSATRNCDRRDAWLLNILDFTVFAYCATVHNGTTVN